MQVDTLYQQLNEYWQSNHFTSSWIIETNDRAKAIAEVSKFLQNVLQLNTPPDCANYPDIQYVAVEDKHKYISIKQIQQLQLFLHNSPMIGEYKFAIIDQAQLMNANAANSCLKLLEDTPNHSYIFMLLDSGASMLPTIESRSFKLNLHYSNSTAEAEKPPSLHDNRLEFLQNLPSKLDKDTVNKIASSYISALRNILSTHTLGTPPQDTVLQQFATATKTRDIVATANKLQAIQKLLEDFLQYDLDGKATLILMGDILYGNA